MSTRSPLPRKPKPKPKQVVELPGLETLTIKDAKLHSSESSNIKGPATSVPGGNGNGNAHVNLTAKKKKPVHTENASILKPVHAENARILKEKYDTNVPIYTPVAPSSQRNMRKRDGNNVRIHYPVAPPSESSRRKRGAYTPYNPGERFVPCNKCSKEHPLGKYCLCDVCLEPHEPSYCPYLHHSIQQGAHYNSAAYALICQCGNTFNEQKWSCTSCFGKVAKLHAKYCTFCNVFEEHSSHECPVNKIGAAEYKCIREKDLAAVPVYYNPEPPPSPP